MKIVFLWLRTLDLSSLGDYNIKCASTAEREDPGHVKDCQTASGTVWLSIEDAVQDEHTVPRPAKRAGPFRARVLRLISQHHSKESSNQVSHHHKHIHFLSVQGRKRVHFADNPEAEVTESKIRDRGKTFETRYPPSPDNTKCQRFFQGCIRQVQAYKGRPPSTKTHRNVLW